MSECKVTYRVTIAEAITWKLFNETLEYAVIDMAGEETNADEVLGDGWYVLGEVRVDDNEFVVDLVSGDFTLSLERVRDKPPSDATPYPSSFCLNRHILPTGSGW